MFADLNEANATLTTMWGEASVTWKKSGESVDITIRVPWNCSAFFHAPDHEYHLGTGDHAFTIPHNVKSCEAPIPV